MKPARSSAWPRRSLSAAAASQRTCIGVGQGVSGAPDQTFASYGAAFDIATKWTSGASHRRGIGCRCNWLPASRSTTTCRCWSPPQAASFYTSIRTFEQRLQITRVARPCRSAASGHRATVLGRRVRLDCGRRSRCASAPSRRSELEAACGRLERAERAARRAAQYRNGGWRWIPEAGLDVIVDLPASLLDAGRTSGPQKWRWPRNRRSSA